MTIKLLRVAIPDQREQIEEFNSLASFRIRVGILRLKREQAYLTADATSSRRPFNFGQ
jgi:hypothetical protein